MRPWMKAGVGIAGGAAAGAAAAVAIAGMRWGSVSANACSRLAAQEKASELSTYSESETADLPDPVRRFFLYALPENGSLARTAHVEQAGLFRLGAGRTFWRPYTAIQRITCDPPGFVWDASIRMAPGISIRVRDSFVSGEAAMEGRIAALFPVVSQHGTPELASGALHRYLAEAVWMPPALLPRYGVVWEPISRTAACATLTRFGITVSLEFDFGEQGEIIHAYTPERFRDVKGRAVPTPWACSYRDYERVNSVMVPRHGEVAWILPNGPLSYCRVGIRNIEC